MDEGLGTGMKIGIILVGVPGCGKSTISRKLCEQFVGRDVRTFSLDACRIDFLGQTGPDGKATYAAAFSHATDHPAEFTATVASTWAKALTGEVVIVDNTNLTVKSRAQWISGLRQKGFKVVGIQVMAPLSLVVERQASRHDKSVPISTVTDMYMRHQEVLLGAEVDTLINVFGFGDVVIPAIA